MMNQISNTVRTLILDSPFGRSTSADHQEAAVALSTLRNPAPMRPEELVEDVHKLE